MNEKKLYRPTAKILIYLIIISSFIFTTILIIANIFILIIFIIKTGKNVIDIDDVILSIKIGTSCGFIVGSGIWISAKISEMTEKK